MKISLSGRRLIQELNGLRINAYQDNHGVWTIGYGTVRWPNGRMVSSGDKLSGEEEAQRLFDYSIQSPVRVVNTHVKVRLTQNQFDALVSLVYCIRGRNFNNSPLLALVNTGRFGEAEAMMLEMYGHDVCRVTAGSRGALGLVRARKREVEVFKML